MTTELLMLRSIEKGLSLRDWEIMTPGMIVDYIITYNNDRLDQEEMDDEYRPATQSDYDRF